MAGSNLSSKFSDFRLDVNGETITTGIHYFPPLAPTTTPSRPLLIFLHGATCSAHNFDATPIMTASFMADALSVPVLSLNRPGYLGSTPHHVGEDGGFHRALGTFYHEKLFPLLWQKWGVSLGCTAMVVNAHSMGAPAMIIAAALHAKDVNDTYPLAGIIFSGWGVRPSAHTIPHPKESVQKFPWKRQIMLGRPEWRLASDDAEDALHIQDHPAVEGEMIEQRNGMLTSYWRTFSDQVVVPVMYGIAEFDMFFAGTQEHVKEMEGSFPRASRFDGSVVLAAPHAIEWSLMSRGWYARCFGFAIEAAALYEYRRQHGVM